MSAYAVSKFLFQLNRPQDRAEFLDRADNVVHSFDGLTEDERAAILNRDVVYLKNLGVSIYLIRTLELISGSGIVETGLKFGGPGPRVISGDQNPGER